MATPSFSFNPEHLKFPEWQAAYHAAVLEIDRNKVLERVQAAEAAIAKRFQALPENSSTLIEREAMFDAVGTLRFLRLDAQRKPPSSCPKLA